MISISGRISILDSQDDWSYYISMANDTNKQLKREKLLTEGVNLLMEQGYHGTGLQEILASVQIPKGSFYNYFGSKENFGAEVVQHYIEPFIDRLSAHLNTPELNAYSALRQYMYELVDELETANYKGGCLLGNLMGEIGDTSEICRNSLQSALRRYRNLYIDALQRAQQQGLVRIDKTAEVMADLLINSWQGALLRMKIEQSCEPLQQCLQELLEDYIKPKL